MKFGEIFINTCAGNRNTHKVLMYIRSSGRSDEFVALDGDKVQFYNTDREIFTKVGEVDLATWKKLAEAQTQ